MKKSRIFIALLLILALFTFIGCTNEDVDLDPDNGTENGILEDDDTGIDNDLNDDIDNDLIDDIDNDLDDDGIDNNGDDMSDGAITEDDAKTE